SDDNDPSKVKIVSYYKDTMFIQIIDRVYAYTFNATRLWNGDSLPHDLFSVSRVSKDGYLLSMVHKTLKSKRVEIWLEITDLLTGTPINSMKIYYHDWSSYE